ncbi:MAG: hypothetical protein NTW65_07830 [Deltaproteobacteria bacterium]|nr:hypothetical protein [Deltaproteobacteria bacterium]
MINSKDITFIENNFFAKFLYLLVFLIIGATCLLLLFEIVDELIQKKFSSSIIDVIFFIILLLMAYIDIINFNEKIGFSPDAIILKRRKIKQIWKYDDIDWLSCSFGEVDLPYNKFGQFLGRLFFKPITDMGVGKFCYRGKIFNLSQFSGSEFRKLAETHLEPHKIITHIQAQKLLSEKSHLSRINYKISYNPYYILLAILAFGVFLIVLFGK